MTDWKTIESVPCADFGGEEEPTRVLLWNIEYGAHVGHAYRRLNGDPRPMVAGFTGMDWTHWHPLPAPPFEKMSEAELLAAIEAIGAA